ncbi:hypothetical protein [Haladaptatus salinisoli]|uniref:hypothetical protein n=1 Tax=Haladaptatus salinisoli TaxID=2884876 RepID=UPI001D09A70A|nr:hypothetical protein [Haladaptatus salinisoli]
MSVFLVQTNGHEISEDAAPEYIWGAQGPTFVDEPLRHHRYFNANPYWKREGYGRRDAWESATEGDTALLYCSSSVDQYPTCISHILLIEDKQIDTEGALLEFETPVEIEPKITYQEIQRLVDQGEFSEKMNYCGQQGFNFTQVANSDLDKVNELTTRV